MLQNVTANFDGTFRHDKMKGKPYIVASMIMMVEGVHEGSGGALYYSAKELKKSVPFWNSKPVVVYHPQSNGQFISACDPDILTNHGVGMIMNTVWDDGKLKAEAWIDVERANAVDDRIMQAIENNEMMELSTGLITECEEVEDGEWNGESYTAIVSNFHPDHLALLPDIQGACSIEDGAGFLRLNKAKNSLIIDVTTMADKERKYVLKNTNGVLNRISHSLAKMITDEISFDDTRQRLQSMLREKLPDDDFVWIEDVFDDYFIYEKAAVLYKQEYEDVDSDISFNGIPVVVVKETNYVIKTNRKDIKMAKKKKETIVNSLIVAESTLWTDDDKEDLMAMEVEVLEKMVPVVNEEEDDDDGVATKKKKQKEAVANAAQQGAAEATVENKANKGEDNKPQTADEYIKNAPKEIQSMLRNGMDSYSGEKAKVITFITDNERNQFTKEQLEAKELSELKTLAALAANTEERKEVLENLNNYSGQGEVVNSDDDDEEPMSRPTVNWAEEAEKKLRKKAG